MKKTVLVAFIVCFSSFLFSQTQVQGDVLTSTWTLENSPYEIMGDIVILNGERLTIEEGVEVVFYGHYMINVQGSIVANGTSDEMITFRSVDEETKWFGIRFLYTTDNSPSTINYCHIRDAKSILEELTGEDAWDLRHGGAIYSRNFSNFTVSNCIIENNIAATGAGIGLMYSSPTIKDNLIRYNLSTGPSSGWGAGISIAMDSNPMVRGNIIEYNACEGPNYCGGSGMYIEQAEPKIHNNIVRYNTVSHSAKNYDGAAFYIHTASPQFVGNLIYGNYGLDNVNDGGGFFLYMCNSHFVNNTIKTNLASRGGGFFFRESSPVFHNNIIRYNDDLGGGEQIYLNDDNCDPDFINNNIQGGVEGFGGSGADSYTGDYINNVDEDPKYVDAKGDDFNLTSDSPCVNSGLSYIEGFEFPLDDLNGNLRIFGDDVDMGACEFGSTSEIQNGELIIKNFTLDQNYPNPFNPTTTIKYSISETSSVNLNVYNMQGQLVKNLVNEVQKAGIHNVEFRADDIISGVYFYSLVLDGAVTESKKMILVK
ncbi:MAG: T9SS type A sorting domain-containing protein [Candidatus Delongbacteria bacterium]|nr:T9SS type A sorting domain-containing protein [Candidatus Delongbacteria bacterium]